MNSTLEPSKMASDNNRADMFASLLNEMGSSINHTTDIMDYISPDFSDKSLQQLMALFGDNFSSSAQPSLEMLEREQLFVTILYGSAIAVALMGNLAVLLAFFFGRRRDSDLSVFLANLAFSDIILSVFCMPFTMSQVVKHHWPFSDALCPIVMFLQLSSVISSVYTLVAVGVDRYFFVTRPLKARLTKRKAKLVIGCIWALAYGLSSIQLAVVRCTNFVYNGQVYKDCQEGWPSDDHRKAYTVIVALLTYILPLLMLVFTYIRIGGVLWHRQIPGQSDLYLDVELVSTVRAAVDRRVRAKQRVIKMLVIVVLMFVLCWLPLHCFFLAVDFFPEKISEWRNDGNELNFSYTFLAIHFLAMSSSFVNPLIYSFMSQNFRSDIIQIWEQSISSMQSYCCWSQWKNSPDSNMYGLEQANRRTPTNSAAHFYNSHIVIQRTFSQPTPSVSACRTERRSLPEGRLNVPHYLARAASR